MRFNTLYNWQVIHKIEWRKWEEKRGITQHKKALSRNAKRQFNLEGVDTLDAPPTREPDLGHKKKSRLARLLRPLSKLFPYQFRML